MASEEIQHLSEREIARLKRRSGRYLVPEPAFKYHCIAPSASASVRADLSEQSIAVVQADVSEGRETPREDETKPRSRMVMEPMTRLATESALSTFATRYFFRLTKYFSRKEERQRRREGRAVVDAQAEQAELANEPKIGPESRIRPESERRTRSRRRSGERERSTNAQLRQGQGQGAKIQKLRTGYTRQ
uniref:Uncharacterized protein n=1 Tax=Kwoniella dejecticola CBS 10117 TaxID=1296121 RepID=A0A1A6AAW1_9TREE|nr:uncharacterized protein I303_03213 [Kwoniella dejecticola CBS 10117]OBR87189.1 hypothetical protein I303_03213 [Kwoniella dejecticola CBS 10117]